MYFLYGQDCAVAHVLAWLEGSHRGVHFQFQDSALRICGVRRDIGTGFYPSTSVSPF